MSKKLPDLVPPPQEPPGQTLEQGVLLGLVAYSCRRVYLTILPLFQQRMAQYALRPVEFTVLSLLKWNPNINQKRLSQEINVSPPNLAILLDKLESRGLVARQRNPLDKRSQTLLLTAEGETMCCKAETIARELELESTAALSDDERAQLLKLLRKIFLTE